VGASKSYAPSEQLGAADFRIRLLADKFLYRGLVRVNAYKCAKFQVLSSISYRDMEGIPDRPTSRSRKLLRLAEDILRLASRLAAAYGLRLRLTAKIG